MKFLIGKLIIFSVIHTVSPTHAPPLFLKPIPLIKPMPQIALVDQVPVQPIAPPTPAITPASSGSPNTYEAGQCVWAVKNWRPELPNNWHNAAQWLDNAKSIGWPTGSVPRINAVAWEYPRQPLGHVALVIGINADGTVLVREMNYHYIPFQIDERIASASDFMYIY